MHSVRQGITPGAGNVPSLSETSASDKQVKTQDTKAQVVSTEAFAQHNELVAQAPLKLVSDRVHEDPPDLSIVERMPVPQNVLPSAPPLDHPPLEAMNHQLHHPEPSAPPAEPSDLNNFPEPSAPAAEPSGPADAGKIGFTDEEFAKLSHEDLLNLTPEQQDMLTSGQEEILMAAFDRAEETNQQQAQNLNNKAQVLDSHAQVLDNHAQVLDNHAQVLDNHAQILDNHAQTLDNNAQILDNQEAQDIVVAEATEQVAAAKTPEVQAEVTRLLPQAEHLGAMIGGAFVNLANMNKEELEKIDQSKIFQFNPNSGEIACPPGQEHLYPPGTQIPHRQKDGSTIMRSVTSVRVMTEEEHNIFKESISQFINLLISIINSRKSEETEEEKQKKVEKHGSTNKTMTTQRRKEVESSEDEVSKVKVFLQKSHKNTVNLQEQIEANRNQEIINRKIREQNKANDKDMLKQNLESVEKSRAHLKEVKQQQAEKSHKHPEGIKPLPENNPPPVSQDAG